MSKVTWKRTYECDIVAVDKDGVPLACHGLPADNLDQPLAIECDSGNEERAIRQLYIRAAGWRRVRVTYEVLEGET